MHTSNARLPVDTLGLAIANRPADARLKGRYCAILSRHTVMGLDATDWTTFATDDMATMRLISTTYVAEHRLNGQPAYAIVWDRKKDKLESYVGVKAGLRALDKRAVSNYMKYEA